MKSKNKNRIALVSNNGLNFQHNCINSFIALTIKAGYGIDFFTIISYHDKIENEHPNLKIIPIKRTKNIKILGYLHLRNKYIEQFQKEKYITTVFIDNLSLITYTLLAGKYIKRAVYFQLEITDNKLCKSLKEKILKRIEIQSAKKIDFTMAFDLSRAAYCAGEFKTTLSHFLIFPNSPFLNNPFIKFKKGNIREKYNISQTKKIIGYVGMVDEYTFPPYLVDQILTNEEYQFYIHTHKKHLPYYLIIKEKLKDKVIFSDSFVSPSELQLIYGDIDIGLLIGDYSLLENKYTTVNQELIGLSAGKLNLYFSCGIPVIYTPKVSWEFIEQYKCGEPFIEGTKIYDIIRKIEENYVSYSKNSYDFYLQNMDPIKAFDKIKDRLFE